MPVQEPSAPVPPPSSIAPTQELPTSPSNFLGDAPTIDPPPGKKAAKKKKAPKKRVATKAKPAEQADAPAPQRARYEPYRKADPTPEPEGNLPADPEELETLDATAKMLYKSDREVLEYIETLKHRTAAMLEHVNRTDSQLRSCKGVMGRIQLFVGQWKKIGDRWTHQELFGDDNFRAKWENGKMKVLGSNESSDEEDAPNPDLFPTLTRNEDGAFPTIEEHLSKIFRNVTHPDFPHNYVRDVLGEPAPQPPNNGTEEEDLFRPETPPARQPSLPPGHEDENGLEYAEDEIEMHSDFPAPPDHPALASDDCTFDCSGADLRITSDTGVLFPPSDEELARISKEFKREAMDATAALVIRPPTNFPHPRHPLAQSYVPSSPDPVPRPEPQHLVVPRLVLRTPSPSHVVLGGKRKRVSTPVDKEEDEGTGYGAGPSTTTTYPNGHIPRQVEARNDEDRVSPKRQRLITRQSSWDFRMSAEAGFVPALPRADPPTHENSPEFSQSVRRQASPPSVGTSQIQKEDSELEKSQVIEILSQGVEQGGSEDEEEPTQNILAGLGESQPSAPALTPDNTQATSAGDTQSRVETPAQSQVPAEVPAVILEDVFGPAVLSVKVDKISDRLSADIFQRDDDGDIVMSNSEHKTANVSSKSARFSLDGETEKEEHKVFRKTPIRPRASLRVMEAENALAAEVEAEKQDVLNPLPSPKRRRAIGGQARRPKIPPSIKAEPTVDPESGLSSVSASKPPSKLRRGRSTSVQPEVPALPKTPVRKSTRSRK
ncbi:hypothetical protein BDM02DRAFT_3132313 [Thelephora ganbajun]|uniref:Uncharacterized protein n=1 Tax=Thelephora ganbajun TaxID=370292 RepID=A0ACB6Z1J8_THEGA|nr:hypothetical protein BDM02DRAFT_3132313 [Thelephora ganbajun]